MNGFASTLKSVVMSISPSDHEWEENGCDTHKTNVDAKKIIKTLYLLKASV